MTLYRIGRWLPFYVAPEHPGHRNRCKFDIIYARTSVHTGQFFLNHWNSKPTWHVDLFNDYIFFRETLIYLSDTADLYNRVHSDIGSRWPDLNRYHRSDRVYWHIRPHLWKKNKNFTSFSDTRRPSIHICFYFTSMCVACCNHTVFCSAHGVLSVERGCFPRWNLT